VLYSIFIDSLHSDFAPRPESTLDTPTKSRVVDGGIKLVTSSASEMSDSALSDSLKQSRSYLIVDGRSDRSGPSSSASHEDSEVAIKVK
jgi:hypothetical protein